MPAPRRVAHVNKRVLNRVRKFIVPWAPDWAVAVHRGRRYWTPPWAFRRYDGFVIALTYGFNSDWVRNVVAASECETESGRRRYEVANPHIYFAKMPARCRQ